MLAIDRRDPVAMTDALLEVTARPDDLDEQADEIVALLPMLRRLPRRVDRIAAAVEGGRLSVNVRLLADERDRTVITGWVQLGVLAVLAATAGGMAVALLALKGGPAMTETISLYQFLGYCLLVICSLLALRVLAAVFRTGP
jgi:ubiquinone biosynthesis protein